MNPEQLIFQAADAAEQARLVLGDLWRELPDGTAAPTLDAAKCERLNQQATRLHCATQELLNRAHGWKGVEP